MDKRELTGKWYLTKRFWGGYKVMVQVNYSYMDPNDFSYSPTRLVWLEAKPYELFDLGIKLV